MATMVCRLSFASGPGAEQHSQITGQAALGEAEWRQSDGSTSDLPQKQETDQRLRRLVRN